MKTVHKDKLKVFPIQGSEGWVDLHVEKHHGPGFLMELNPEEQSKLISLLGGEGKDELIKKLYESQRREKFWVARTHSMQARNSRLSELNQKQAAKLKKLKKGK